MYCILQLFDTYFEAYNHVTDPTERHKLAQVLANIMHRKPRFDFDADYFIKTFRLECACLRLETQLVKSILDAQVCY